MKTKVEVGSVLGQVFSIYRDRAGVLLPVAFWLFLGVAILEELSYAYLVTTLFAGLLGMAATIVYQGMVVGLVRDVERGWRDSSAGDMFGSVRPVLVPLTVASLLAVLGVILGTIFFVIPGLIAVTFWAVIAPAIVVERTGAIEAFGRSQDLVSGNGGRVFATVVVGLLVVLVLVVPVLLLTESALDYGPLLRIVSSALAGALAAPVSGLTAAVLYFRLREIEGAPASVGAETTQ